MKDIKNYLIAMLAGLLVLTLSTHSAQSAPKKYDAVKLAAYAGCFNNTYGFNGFNNLLYYCNNWKP